MKVKVYSLLSLSESDILKCMPNAIIEGPIKRWDIERDIDERVQVIAIIDGKFDHVAPVAPGEIMDALRVGVRVYGASSMGALRAAELYPYGMIGHGKVYELIRKTAVFRDDFVGQIILENQSAETSLPFVDFYLNLLTLIEKKKLSRATASRMEKVIGKIHFSQRNAATIVQLVEMHFGKDPKVARLLRAAATTMGSQKRRDGMDLLKLIQRELQGVHKDNLDVSRGVGEAKSGAFCKYWDLK